MQSNINRPLSEVQTPIYPAFLQKVADGMTKDIKVLDTDSIRCDTKLQPHAFDALIESNVARIASLGTGVFQGDRAQIVDDLAFSFEFALNSSVVIQLIHTRQGIAATGLRQTGQSNPLPIGPRLANPLTNLINQLGDYHQPTGLTALTVEMNADIFVMVGQCVRIACLQWGPEVILKGTDVRPEHLLETAHTIVDPEPNPERRVPAPVQLIFPGDTKGRDAIRLYVGKAYDTLVNSLPPVGPNQYYPFPKAREIARIIHDMETHAIATIGVQGDWPFRNNRQVPPSNEVIDATLRVIMTQEGMQALQNFQPQGGQMGEFLDRLRAYFLVLGFPPETDENVYQAVMNSERIRVLPHMTIKMMYQAITTGATIYNQRVTNKVEAVTAADSHNFIPSDGGTAAMLVTEHQGYANDDNVSIYKAPFGITKAQQMYGFMLNQTSDVFYRKVWVKVNSAVHTMRSNMAEQYVGQQKIQSRDFNK